MTRADALALAIEHVEKIAPPTARSTFPGASSPLEARGALILQFAEFLMLGDPVNPNAMEDPNRHPGVDL